MLALTPAPLQTAGERALFGELTRWDTGASVRAAVVAALPLIDGPLGRRISDAVLLVPEGIAVVRIAEVLRQSGVIKAVPEGAWTIAPESGPGQALQLAGGGSTPLDGLMRAGMEVAMKLRRAGLEPGRIARLTVLVGDVTGLVPADGDLGEGDLVSLLETRSLLLGIARSSRYSGVDNPRLWTTADVRAALEALELPGRGPSVEELNGEGFPYSPYVLRRPELLAPAALGAPATPAPAPATAPAGQEPPAPPVREQPSPEAIAAAVAASAAAGHAAAAQEAAAAQQAGVQQAPGPVAPPRDTVAIDEPSASRDDAGGIGGLFAGAEPEPPAVGKVVPPRTAAPPTAAFQQPPPPAPPAMPPLYWDQNQQAEDAEERSGARGRVLLMTLVAVLVVAALGLGGWFLLRDGDDGGSGGTGAAPTAPQTQVTGPAVGDVQVVGAAEYRVEALQVDATCAGHAYGDTADFFAGLDCTGLSRALYSTQVEGAAVVVAVSRVRMPDTGAARNLQALTDRNGSGNVSDLLREGVRYTGSPDELSGAEYASAVSGPAVTIVESAWVDEETAGSSAAIDAVAEAGLSLATPPFE
ncbi:hypothetical protein [Blastococcus litoris]|uniref:hypothetical protein n=1 Tax=Blastococcus litoris TaxID=2171622 RepID=UPI000E3094B0|nr:hypothetical protein [Blastococcus litoris]